MRRNGGWTVPIGAALAAALSLGGCSSFDGATASMANAISGTGERFGAPWGGMHPGTPEESATIQRVRGVTPPLAALSVEPGDVWPVQEAPRATLANPDAALRGIPTYRPGELDRMSSPAGRSSWQPTDPPPVRGAPADLGGSSSPPPPPLGPIERPQPRASAPPLPPVAGVPPRRDGQVIQTPGGPVVTNGGTDRVQTFVAPGGVTGTAVRDGNTTTLITPGGGVQVVPTPR
jgi:hypothetical protein